MDTVFPNGWEWAIIAEEMVVSRFATETVPILAVTKASAVNPQL